MCVSPSKIHLKDHGVVTVPCRDCSRCRYNKLHDWLGRCYAESLHATMTVVLTLTYRDREGFDGVTAHYEDVQNMLKHLRADGFPVRYIVCKEWGTKKGRVHWHIVLFFQDMAPLFEFNQTKYEWKYWRWGYTYADVCDYHSLKYVMKYVLKEEGTGKQSFLRMSKKPIIGYQHICKLAQRAVDAGHKPKNPSYRFEGIKLRTGPNAGKARVFWLSARAAEIFKTEFLKRYFAKHGRAWCEHSEMLFAWQTSKKGFADDVHGEFEPLVEIFRKHGYTREAALRASLRQYGAQPDPGGDFVYFETLGLSFEEREAREKVDRNDQLVRDSNGNWAIIGFGVKIVPPKTWWDEEGVFHILEPERFEEVRRWHHVLESEEEVEAVRAGRYDVLDHRSHPDLPRPIHLWDSYGEFLH